MNQLMTNPMFNIGMGLLSANQPSFTPQNPVNSVMQNLQYGAQLKRQQEQDAMRQKLYDIQIAGIERQNQARQSQANFLMDAYGMGGGQRGNLIATTDATQPYTQNLNALAASGITPEMIKMAAASDSPLEQFSKARTFKLEQDKVRKMQAFGEILRRTDPSSYILYSQNPEFYTQKLIEGGFESPTTSQKDYKFTVNQIKERNKIRAEKGYDPLPIPDYLTWLKDMAEAKSTRVTTNVQTGEVEDPRYADVIGESGRVVADEIQENFRNSRGRINDAGKQLSLLESMAAYGYDTGHYAKLRVKIKDAFGVEDPDVKLQKTFFTTTAKSLSDIVSKWKGAISEKEMEVFFSQIEGVDKPMFTNYAIVRMKQIQAEIAKHMVAVSPEFEAAINPKTKKPYGRTNWHLFYDWYEKNVRSDERPWLNGDWKPTVKYFKDEFEEFELEAKRKKLLKEL